MAADVAVGDGAKDGVGQGVQQHVSVRMADESGIMLYLQAAEPDVIAGAECVDVVAKAGAYVGKLCGQSGFSAAEVFEIGELHVSSLAGDCVNGMPGPLHGGGVVGKIHHARSACALMGIAD